MSNLIPWRVYARPMRGAAVYRGMVYAEDRTAATDAARGTFPSIHPKQLAVLADATWPSLSRLERDVFLGVFTSTEPATEEDRSVQAGLREARMLSPTVRECLCAKCRKTIRYTKGSASPRWGRPPKYHDACAPAEIIRWRRAREKRDATRPRSYHLELSA